MTKAKEKGLTLVELMIVIAVMSIIAAVAYPLYTNQVQKSRRADAKVALESVAMAQERYFTLAGQYAAALSSLQVSTALQAGNSDEGYYAITVARSGGSNERFTATATARSTAAQRSDTNCATFTINEQGVKTATDGGGTNCW